MSRKNPIRLGVNIDHVATLRQARGTDYPDPVAVAIAALEAGADGITLHLREDRRHIQDADLWKLKQSIHAPINLEMAVTEEMLTIAEKFKPQHCCLVPEKRQEITTEGGLDVLSQEDYLRHACQRLNNAGILVSLFIDPDPKQVEAAVRCKAPIVELTTGPYSEAETLTEKTATLERLKLAAHLAGQRGLIVNAGHGLNKENVKPVAAIPNMHELNIGHSIIADSIYIGIKSAVKAMKKLMQEARKKVSDL
ncbi:MAG: pyridoxine 5'-phosphate synthase [Proteobacteria bacterium]|nr:pyridoxine 5'-phosphate synthase [Pseudomonadota bacterium]